MSGFIISGHARAPRRFARTQREAGMEFAEWEGRLAPQSSWLQLGARVIGGGLVITAVLFLTLTGGWP